MSELSLVLMAAADDEAVGVKGVLESDGVC